MVDEIAEVVASRQKSISGRLEIHVYFSKQGQLLLVQLTHWGRVTHICVGNLTITGSDNGLSPGRRQAIIWTNAGILLIGPLGTNFSKIFIEIHKFSFKKMRLKVSSAKWRLCCLDLNVLMVFEAHVQHQTGTCTNTELLPI